jgi:hypothetical protein
VDEVTQATNENDARPAITRAREARRVVSDMSVHYQRALSLGRQSDSVADAPNRILTARSASTPEPARRSPLNCRKDSVV